MTEHYLNQVCEAYSRRATSYDASSGGWHAELADDFVRLLDPKPGELALDLACGTGLVTLPLAGAISPEGSVVAVDLTSAMIDVSKKKLEEVRRSKGITDLAPIKWIRGDITSPELLEEATVKDAMTNYGGFDIISVCSAFVLLADQAAAIHFWTEKLLRKGGRMIIDVPTEDITVQLLMTYHLPVALGLSSDLAKGRLWIKDQSSLAGLCECAGLKVEQITRTRSYVKETWYDDHEENALQVLEKELKRYSFIEEKGKLDQARKVWPRIWKHGLRRRADGRQVVVDAHWLYICIASKY